MVTTKKPIVHHGSEITFSFGSIDYVLNLNSLNITFRLKGEEKLRKRLTSLGLPVELQNRLVRRFSSNYSDTKTR